MNVDMVQAASRIAPMPASVAAQAQDAVTPFARGLTAAFYATLREEVTQGNALLTSNEQSRLQSHYPTMMSGDLYPVDLAAAIYVARRSPAVKAVIDTTGSVVFDAGCAFGSESFLFATLGAKVLAVDIDKEQVAIAKKRQRYYEDIYQKPLDITLEVCDLNEFDPGAGNISLTWIASVLAAIPDQDALLARIYEATRPCGQVMITDMNLINPLFFAREFLRRKRAQAVNPAFGREADFWSMFSRKGRRGARYHRSTDGAVFDDVQFFTPSTIRQAIKDAGFGPNRSICSGFGLPNFGRFAVQFERFLGGIPGLNSMGYFYLASGSK